MTGTVIAIAGSAMQLKEGTLNIRHRVDDKDTATFTIIDSSGTLAFSKGQTVSITDASLPNPNLFSGYINKPTATNLYPNSTNEWSMDCVSQFYVAAKKSTTTSKAKPKRGGKHVKQQSGAIVANQIQQYLAPDGITGNFALDWSELQTDWQTGTQSGVVAATNTSTGNVGAGDLELAPGGSQITVNGPGSGFILVNGLLFTGYASSGYSAAFTNRQIWSGSQALHTGDAFLYDVWVASTSPAIKAGADFICSDGTVFSTSATQDKQYLSPLTSTDLSGLANDTWYTRVFSIPASLNGKTLSSVTVGFNSASAGMYTAYFRRIEYQVSGGGTVTFFGDSSTLQTNTQINNQGYTNVSLTQVQLEDKSTVVTHASLSIGAASIVQGSQMSWTSALPSGATAKRETSIDNGATWQQITSGSAVPNLLAGMVVAGRSIQYRDTLTVGTDPTSNIGLSGPTLIVNSAPNSTKTDSITSYTTTADFNSGTLTNLITTGSNGVTLNGAQENWDDGDFSSQPLFGTASPFQQVENKQMILQGGTGTDVKSQQQWAGQWQNFTAEVDVSIPAANTQCGLVYRTVGWQNLNDTYGYVATVSTTQIQLGRGTNVSSGAGAFTSIATAALSLAVNSLHRLKIVINGSTHQVYLDSVLLINTTDATYGATGYLGLRMYNNSGSTQSVAFDNFGVCSSLSGTWQSPSINIAGPATYGNAEIFWDVDGIPDSTCSITGQTSIDGGSTFQSVTNGGAISGLTAGQSLVGKTLILKLTLTANNAPVVPVLNGVTAWVMGQYSSSGTRSTAPLAWDSMIRGNVVGSFGTATNGATYTKSGTGTVALTSNEALISNTTGDVQMQIGTLAQQDTDETIRFELSASTISAGMELHFSDSSHYYRLVASTTALNVVRNVGGGNSTIATSAVTLSTGTFYRMRFRAVSTGLTSLTFYGRVWLDGISEPSTWNVTIADSPYKATILADSPLHYYRLDDTGSSAVDLGSSVQNGTLNGTIKQSQAGLLIGDTDTSMLFDGATGYVALPNTGTWPTGNGAWSLECWCIPTNSTNGANGHIITIGNSGTNSAVGAICQTSTGGFGVVTWGGAGHDFQGNGSSVAGQIYYLAATYDGAGNLHLYVGTNGAITTYGPFSCGTLNLSAVHQSIAQALGFGLWFPGIVDEAAIYGSTLSSQQVLNHFNAGLVTGGFALMANGTGSASFDSYRVTAYPDPSVSLLSAGRAVNSLCNWNGIFPNNTNVAVSTSLDNGTTWQPHANPSDYIPTISTAAYYAAVRANIPSSNLAGFYRLNEKSGLVAYDSSNNAHTATLNGGITLGQSGALQGVNEVNDTSMLFDGSTGYVMLPAGIAATGLTTFTVECWIKLTSVPTSTNPRVITDGNGFQLGIAGTSTGGFPTGPAGTVGFILNNGTSSVQVNSTTQLTAGVWTYIVASWDGSNIHLYINGSLQSTSAFTGTITSTSWPITIGRNPAYNGDYFPGSVQNLSLYANLLSAGTITANYNAATQATQAVYSDSFTVNTSAQYTQTFGTGGSGATSWTWDTANSRVVAVGGSRALLVFNTFTAGDIDIFTDWFQAENGGFIWRYTNASNYYELIIKDSTNGNTFTLNKMSAGTLTTLSTASIVFPVGTHHRCHLTMLGGVITAFLDENQILTYTDGSPLASGQWGLRNDTGTSYCYLLQSTPQAANISNLFLCVKQQLTTSDPTVTPQITDHQALVSDNTIGTGVTISSVDYRTTYVSDNIDDQNTQSNYWWNINNTGAVTFQPRNAANAPYILQSSDILIGTLPTVEYSGDLYRNQQVLKGVVQNSIFSQNFIGDGQSKTWNVANPISGVPTITLNGQAQSVGIQGVDSGKQFYYQLNSTSITQDNSGTVLRKDLDVLGVAYLGAIGIDFELDNTGQFSNTISQAQMAATDKTTGIVSAIADVSSQNMDVNAATTYANQLLARYGSIARTLVCDTLHNGLQIGQSLPVFIPQLNIFDSVFLIVEIGITVRTVAGGPQYVYHLVCSESAALSSWVKTFSKLMRSVTGTHAKV